MPSPFPGMNPYLEQRDVWHDFHEDFMSVARAAISSQVLPRYFVKIDEHVYIHELPEESSSRHWIGRADLAITATSKGAGSSPAAEVATVGAKVRIPPVDLLHLSYLEVRDRRNRQVVTVLELLSPANKNVGPDRDTYITKRKEFLASGVHLVEIDLLRGGPRMPMTPVNDLPPADYGVFISRYQDRPLAEYLSIRLRDRLPAISVPLRPEDPPAQLDLQAVLHQIYDAAGYAIYIYDSDPDPTLDPADMTWAREILAGMTPVT